MKEKIFHLSIRNFSRGKGHNAIQKGAYRTGLKIKDEKRGLLFNYEKKANRENITYEMLLPAGADEKFLDPRFFYNEIERSEKRSDARLFKEVEISLFQELSQEENKELARRFSNEILQKYNVPINLNFHKLHSHNPHAHIVVGMREIEGDSFSKKKNRTIDKREFLTETRELWDKLANEKFKENNLNLFVSHKSYKDREINKIPGVHLNKSYFTEEQKMDDIKLNILVTKHNRRIDYAANRRTAYKRNEAVKIMRIGKEENTGKEVNRMDKKMTIGQLYDKKIEEVRTNFSKNSEAITKKKKTIDRKKTSHSKQRESFKEYKEKHMNVMFHKQNDLQELQFGRTELKAELKSYSRFNPFNLQKRREIKRNIIKNRVAQKRKRLEMQREKGRLRYHKGKLKESKKAVQTERKAMFSLYKKQTKAKLQVIKLSREKNRNVDLSKAINVTNLAEYKKQNKIEMKQSKSKQRALA